MILTLVRHGEVLKEYQGKYNGHLDIPLSEKGKEQAKELAQTLQASEFDLIYCSSLLRARETIAAFDVKPIFSEKLREKSWGKHEGKGFSEIEAEGIHYENFEQWINALDGEDMHKYIADLREYFYETILKQDAHNILIVTHAGVIKTLLHIVYNISLEEAFAKELPYASYITLDTTKFR